MLDDVASAQVERHDADTATRSVTAAVSVLGVLTVVGGLVLATPLLDVEGHIGWLLALLSLLLIAGAVLAVRSASRVGDVDPAPRLLGPRTALVDSGFDVDRLYVALVARPVLAAARLVVFLDREVVDAYVRGAAVATRYGARAGDRVHRAERAASGLVWVVTGVVAVALAGVALW